MVGMETAPVAIADVLGTATAGAASEVVLGTADMGVASEAALGMVSTGVEIAGALGTASAAGGNAAALGTTTADAIECTLLALREAGAEFWRHCAAGVPAAAMYGVGLTISASPQLALAGVSARLEPHTMACVQLCACTQCTTNA